MSDLTPYNPLARENLGASVAEAMLKSDAEPLGSLKPFRGAGLYAIYYNGPFPAYADLAAVNRNGQFQVPIYVGKAIPSGARKGGVGEGGSVLFKRLQEHLESVRAAENLNVGDFWCRYLTVEDIWIPLGEALLIAKFSPLWNRLIDGFGNHDPGKGRYEGVRPRWDVLHPGRAWALKCRDRKETAEQIAAEVAAYLAVLPVDRAHQPLLLREDGDPYDPSV